jgi:hypothetical protein
MMKHSTKTILAVLISFIIAFSILSITLYSYHDEIIKFGGIIDSDKSFGLKDTFYSQNFVNDKKLFLIGSSQAGPLNSTHIEKILKNNNQDYHVYNLAENGDKPIFRLKELEMIISSKPALVIYEISSRDFEDIYPLGTSPANKPTTPLPDPSNIFKRFFSDDNLKNNFDFLQNPKIDTFKILRSFINIYGIGPPPVGEIISDSTRPLMRYLESDTIEKTNPELKKMLTQYGTFNGINHPNENQNVIALKKFISEISENDIKIIIFVAPEHKYYLEKMPQEQKTEFELVLKNISTEKKIHIYNLRDKYNDLDIWADPTHLVINENSLIYSNDIAMIILKEMK